jgi:hypothetical protein
MRRRMTSSPRWLAIVIVGSRIFTACGSSTLGHSKRLVTTGSNAAPAAPIGGAGSDTFANAVPEQPWWQVPPSAAVEPPAPKPIHLRWSLSGDILFDSASATLSPAA